MSWEKDLEELKKRAELAKEMGGVERVAKHYARGRLTVRERIDNLIDSDSVFLELGKFAAYEMYKEYGNIPAAGVVVGLGKIHSQECMIIGNDATVKAGAYFELSLKKTLRAQKIALENNPNTKWISILIGSEK